MEIKSDKKALLFGRIFFFLFSLVFLGVCNGEYLYKLQNVSYFVFSDPLMEEVVDQSAGVLIYVSSFLTQFLYYPLLGAVLLSLFLLALEWVVEKLTKSAVLSFVIAGLVLLTMTSVGYGIYDNFRGSFLFSHLLGCLLASAMALAYKRCSATDKGVYVVIAIASISYFFVGVYACITLLFIAVSSLVNKESAMVLKSVVCVAFSLLLPYVASSFIYYENFDSTVWAPIPTPYFMNLFIFSVVTLVLLVLSPLFAEKIQSLTCRFTQVWLPYVALVALCAVVYFSSYRDAEYHKEMKVQRLAESHQWDELLNVAESVETPTKTIFAYRAIALSCKGSLSRNMFKYPCHFKKVKTNYVSEQPRYFEDLFLYASFINNAYLWSMEFWCTTGYSYEHLKKMTICSLLNDEPTLANKYIQVLKNSLFQREWALEYEGYVNHLDKMLEKYPEFAAVKSNLPTQEIICTLDPIRKVYGQYSNLSKKNAERRLLADLYNKDMKVFLRDALQSKSIYAKTDAPECVKEALVICAMQQGNPSILQGFRVTQKTVQNIQNLYNKAKSAKNIEEAKEALAKYQGTYGYFYLFANN